MENQWTLNVHLEHHLFRWKFSRPYMIMVAFVTTELTRSSVKPKTSVNLTTRPFSRKVLYPQWGRVHPQVVDVIYSGCVRGPGRFFMSCTMTRQLSILKYPSECSNEISSLILLLGSKCKSKGIPSSKSSGSLNALFSSSIFSVVAWNRNNFW